MKGPLARSLVSWIVCAKRLFPVPDSPRRRTDVLGLFATRSMSASTSFITSLFPMISPIRDVFSAPLTYFSRCFLLWI